MSCYVVYQQCVLRLAAGAVNGKVLPRKPAADVDSIWLGVNKHDAHTTIDWWPTREAAEAHLRLSDLDNDYEAREYQIHDADDAQFPLPWYARFHGTRQPNEEDHEVWTDCVLTTGIQDLPVGTQLEHIQFDIVERLFYYYAKNGVLLAIEPLHP